ARKQEVMEMYSQEEIAGIYQRQYKMVYQICFMLMKNTPDAEDAAQTVFRKVIERDTPFRDPEHEKAWLIKVTLNGCRKVWRSAWYRHADVVAMEEMPEGSIEEAGNAMEAGILKRERNREILEAVMRLPRKYREVIHLFYFQQMNIKEISAATGRKESTVTSQLTRGREMLKKYLKEEYQYE
ncbi:MAG TPA: hypothetical protein DCZ40_10125, partial [Lachnospiraceae bacterium]|nr:hypothetical protein [Lachnospiraceae bacterium]